MSKLSKRGTELLKDRADVEKQIIDETEAVVRKAWAKFYEPLSQDTIQALITLKHPDGSYVLVRDETEHDVARSYWRQRAGYFGLTIHEPVEIINDAGNVDWWSRER